MGVLFAAPFYAPAIPKASLATLLPIVEGRVAALGPEEAAVLRDYVVQCLVVDPAQPSGRSCVVGVWGALGGVGLSKSFKECPWMARTLGKHNPCCLPIISFQ